MREMSNRKLLLIFFIFGLGLFLLGIGVGKGSIETPQSETLGEKSSQASVPSLEPVQNLKNSQNLHKVLKVIDGDTIQVVVDSKKETLRLIGIDTPETVDPRKPVQCFGKEASAKAKSLLSGKSVRLESDPTQGERDKYQRLLRYVFLEAGTNFNKLMISEGYAHEYTYNTPYKYQSEFKHAQKEAEASKVGLWADGACSSSNIEPKPSGNVQNNAQGVYACDCSKLCGQISSCDEAYYQLNQCGCSKRDSDRDGVPCESICR